MLVGQQLKGMVACISVPHHHSASGNSPLLYCNPTDKSNTFAVENMDLLDF